jgi:hypothetical protein
MFKPTKQRLYQLVGKTKLKDLPPTWQNPVDGAIKQEEKAVSDSLAHVY